MTESSEKSTSQMKSEREQHSHNTVCRGELTDTNTDCSIEASLFLSYYSVPEGSRPLPAQHTNHADRPEAHTFLSSTLIPFSGIFSVT